MVLVWLTVVGLGDGEAFAAGELKDDERDPEATITAMTRPAIQIAPRSPRPPRPPRRRAVVVGIGDYRARGLPPFETAMEPVPGRWLPSLLGPPNDARAMRDVLVEVGNFAPADVRLLLDGAATRSAILSALEEHLVASAGPGDVLVFYFAGHGSQVVNSESDELDGRDETLVPADAALGAPDLRDKELRRLLGRALDRGARLTVILDSCHSGSGVRTSATLPTRGVFPDLRDVADRPHGRTLEERQAVIFSASQDSQPAFETQDGAGTWYGAFTLSLLRAIGRAGVDESAEDLYIRSRAFLHGTEGLSQEPVLAGPEELRRASLFGEPVTRGKEGRSRVVAVQEVRPGGEVVLQAGWLHGLVPGSELRSSMAGSDTTAVRLRVTELLGRTRSVARVMASGVQDSGKSAVVAGPVTGDLFHLEGWAMLPTPPLDLWLPVAGEAERRWAAQVARLAEKEGLSIAEDPLQCPPPSHVLRWIGSAWALEWGEGASRLIPGATMADPLTGAEAVISEVAAHPGPGRLAIEWPVPASLGGLLSNEIEKSQKLRRSDSPAALYRLAARPGGWLARREGIPYGVAEGPDRGAVPLELLVAWVQRGKSAEDAWNTELPLSSRWYPLSSSDLVSRHDSPSGPPGRKADGAKPVLTDTGRLWRVAMELTADAGGLAHVRGWRSLALEAPRYAFPYRLEVRRSETGIGGQPLAVDGVVRVDEILDFHLVATPRAMTGGVRRMYVYVVLVDSAGQCQVIYPRLGGVGNQVPVGQGPAPRYIPLGQEHAIRVTEPYGLDSYYLLATEERIPDPWVLECPSVRTSFETPLGSWFAAIGSPGRGAGEPSVDTLWSLSREIVHARPVDAEEADPAVSPVASMTGGCPPPPPMAMEASGVAKSPAGGAGLAAGSQR